MRKNFKAKHLCYPQPVFIIAAYDADGTPNAMNAAWGGISEEDEISICISPEHKTTENILLSGAFTVSIADADHVTECDYVGIVSGNDVKDKLSVCGFTTSKSALVNAPIINELALTLECKLRSYDQDSCRLVGEIVNVSCDERVLDEKGRPDLLLLRPITYDPFHHTYNLIVDTVGNAFNDGLKLK